MKKAEKSAKPSILKVDRTPNSPLSLLTKGFSYFSPKQWPSKIILSHTSDVLSLSSVTQEFEIGGLRGVFSRRLTGM